MRKISGKILSYLLSVAMVMSSLSLPSFATEIDADASVFEEAVEAELENEFVSEEVVDDTEDEEIIEEEASDNDSEEEVIILDDADVENEEIISEDSEKDSEEEISEDAIPDDVEDEETTEEEAVAEENVESEGDSFGISFIYNGEEQNNWSGLTFRQNVNPYWEVYNKNEDIIFSVEGGLIPDGYLIDEFYYTVGYQTDKKDLKGTEDSDNAYTIPASDVNGTNIYIYLTVKEFVGKITFVKDGDSSDALEFADGDVFGGWNISEKDSVIRFKLKIDLTGKIIKSLTYQPAGATDPVELEDCDANGFYTIPASANIGVDIAIELITEAVNATLNKAKLEGVGTDNVIKLPVGTDKSYKIVKTPTDADGELGVVYSDDHEGFSVIIHQNEVIVEIEETSAENVKGSFDIINKSVKDTAGNNLVLATYKVKGQNPAWITKKVSASVVKATDISIEVKIKPFTAIGSSLYDGSYYYKVELKGEPEVNKEGVSLNPGRITYVTPNSSGNTVVLKPFVRVSTFEGEPVYDDAEVGDGFAANFKVEVTAIKKKSSVAYSPTSENDIFLSSQKLTVSASTKNPKYAEKISIKKEQTGFYAGEGENGIVKIGTVEFDKNATFNTNKNWEIRTVITPLDTYGSALYPYKATDSSDERIQIFSMFSEGDYGDNGIYVSHCDTSLAGEYTVIVATKDGNGQTPEAKISFTIKKCMAKIDFEAPNRILKKANKKVTVKTSVIAYERADMYGEFIKINNPKVRYEIGKLNTDTGKIDKVDGISISNKGVITIDKNYKVTEENKNIKYAVKAYANDYARNFTSSDVCEFAIVDDFVKIKSLEVYLDNGDGFTRLTSKSKVPYDIVFKYGKLRFALKGTNGQYILGGDGKEGHEKPVELPVNGNYDNNGFMLECSVKDENFLYTPSKVTFTAKSVDGSKANVTINVGYATSSNDYDTLAVIKYTGDEIDNSLVKSVPESGDMPYEFVIPSEWGDKPMMSLALADGSILNSNPSESLAVNWPCNSGTISVKGAKIVYDTGSVREKAYLAIYGEKVSTPKKQYLVIQPTNPVINVTLTKQVYDDKGNLSTVKKQYTIKCADSTKSLDAAPKIKSAKIGMPGDNPGEYSYTKLFYGRCYGYRDFVEFELASPLNLPEGVKPKDVHIVLNTKVDYSEGPITFKNFPMVFDMDNNPNTHGAAYYFADENGENPRIRINVSGENIPLLFCEPKHEFSFAYYYEKDLTPNITDDDEFEKVYFTKFSSKYTAKFAKYEKSFKINSTQKLSFSASGNGHSTYVYTDYIQGKGKNVERVELLKVCNSNIKGQYNDFDQFFEVQNGVLAVKESKLSVLDEEAKKSKGKVPASRTGYVIYWVTFEDGTEQVMTSKVTVRFTKPAH